ncbi:MAG: COG4315 family predicted lipoprotein [Georgenia sp.]
MNVRTLAAVGLVAGVALTGCGSTDGADSGAAPESPTTATLGTSTTDLGTFLVDGNGNTLYLFATDSPGTSTCEGPCLDMWPPLTGEAGAGEGVDASLIGTLERRDGTVQVSYNDWPLYYYAPDDGPGDVTGQGVNDVWWVVGPDGAAVMAAADAPKPSGY